MNYINTTFNLEMVKGIDYYNYQTLEFYDFEIIKNYCIGQFDYMYIYILILCFIIFVLLSNTILKNTKYEKIIYEYYIKFILPFIFIINFILWIMFKIEFKKPDSNIFYSLENINNFNVSLFEKINKDIICYNYNNNMYYIIFIMGIIYLIYILFTKYKIKTNFSDWIKTKSIKTINLMYILPFYIYLSSKYDLFLIYRYRYYIMFIIIVILVYYILNDILSKNKI